MRHGGDAFKVLADEWATSPGTHRANLEQTFDTMLAIGSGRFRAELLLFYGVTVFLTGLVVAMDGLYPAPPEHCRGFANRPV